MTDSDPLDYYCMDCDRPVYVNLKKGIKHKCGDSVPIEELEALVQEWEDTAERFSDKEGSEIFGTCANELQEVIDEYE